MPNLIYFILSYALFPIELNIKIILEVKINLFS